MLAPGAGSELATEPPLTAKEALAIFWAMEATPLSANVIELRRCGSAAVIRARAYIAKFPYVTADVDMLPYVTAR